MFKVEIVLKLEIPANLGFIISNFKPVSTVNLSTAGIIRS